MNLEPEPKTTLLESLKQGDEQAVEEVYNTAFHYCASFILNNQGSMEDARGIFQECLIVLFRNLQKEEFELYANLKTYLYGIAKNLWLKQLKKDRKTGLQLVVDDPHSGFSLDGQPDEGERQVQKEEQLQRLEKALIEHSEDCRRLLQMFFYGKKTYREVAQEMQYSENYVRKKKMKCIEALKEKMKD